MPQNMNAPEPLDAEYREKALFLKVTSMRKYRIVAVALLMVIGLAACGGGGGGNSGGQSSASSTSGTASSSNSAASGAAASSSSSSSLDFANSAVVEGVFAVGAPVQGSVYIQSSSNPSVIYKVSSDKNGYFLFDVTTLTPPFILRGESADKNIILHSIVTTKSIQKGARVTANITPLTNLIVASYGAGGDPNSAWINPSFLSFLNVGVPENAHLITRIQPALTALGISTSGLDFIRTPFVANGTGLDKLLDNIAVEQVDMIATAGGHVRVYVISQKINGRSGTATLASASILDPSNQTASLSPLTFASGSIIDLPTVKANLLTAFASAGVTAPINTLQTIQQTQLSGTYGTSAITSLTASTAPSSIIYTASITSPSGNTIYTNISPGSVVNTIDSGSLDPDLSASALAASDADLKFFFPDPTTALGTSCDYTTLTTCSAVAQILKFNTISNASASDKWFAKVRFHSGSACSRISYVATVNGSSGSYSTFGDWSGSGRISTEVWAEHFESFGGNQSGMSSLNVTVQSCQAGTITKPKTVGSLTPASSSSSSSSSSAPDGNCPPDAEACK
jgi:hypothetical protein